MNIGLISDTHGKYSNLWKEHFNRCDILLHAGDLDNEECYNWFMNLGIPVYIVQGNCDRGAWARYLPQSMHVPLCGKLFYLVHNRAYIPMDLDEIDYIIFGHTHIPYCEKRKGIQFINPGTAGNDRGAGKSMMILHLEDGKEEIEKIIL